LREEIARLMSLQAIDRELRELERACATITERIEQLKSAAEQYEGELNQLTEEEQNTGVAQRRMEKELAEGEARIRNKRMRLNQVRNDKENQALVHEVDALRENNQRLETEVMALMEAAQPRAARIAELTTTLEQTRVDLTAAEKDIAVQLEDLKISISKQRIDRDLMVRDVQPSLLQRYETLFNRRNGLAVAEAKGGTCQGCRMRLPPQLYNELQKHLQVHYCPNCQRVLYFEETPRVEE